MISDLFIVLRWWSVLFLFGSAAFPLTRYFFREWTDEGYLFSKAVGLALVGWFVFVFGMAHLAPFINQTIFFSTGIVFVLGIVLHKLRRLPKLPRSPMWKTIFFEELFFFGALLCWVWVKAHEPSIRGLEKFMDYGFMQSIINSRFFPPADMWYPPYSINYYYFGHLVTAMLTKVSGLDLSYTFNLMLSTIFAFCFTMSFSIGRELLRIGSIRPIRQIRLIFGGLFTAFLVTLSGNMQTLYAFTKGYSGDAVKPFWELLWPFSEFFGSVGKGMETYWYANATRFIPFTIHEFPSYSFVVSDVHGHVLSIPFVLLTIGLLLQIYRSYKTHETNTTNLFSLIFYGFLCGIMLMTNALDGPIYVGLFCVSLFVFHWSNKTYMSYWTYVKIIGIVVVAALMTSLPFLSHFTSFVNGIAINCPPTLLANSKLGPILFEGVEKCQRSPFWMMAILWGFFWVSGGIYIQQIGLIRPMRQIRPMERLLVIFFFFSLILIIFPEFFYFKDIYPQHFRSNTMFKLGYDAFILFSIVSGYAIVSFFQKKRSMMVILPLLFLVSIYPYFSVRSYFGGLKKYEGIYGLSWLQREYPDDFAGIQWLQSTVNSKQLTVNSNERKTLVEADGDSYTDFDMYSVFTGTPTVVGWAVHEWLWRGSYDVVSPRRDDVRILYESEDDAQTKKLFDAYHVQFVVVGTKEREKFTKLDEEKFMRLGRQVFEQGLVRIYEIPLQEGE